jgi:hypothetical protein
MYESEGKGNGINGAVPLLTASSVYWLINCIGGKGIELTWATFSEAESPASIWVMSSEISNLLFFVSRRWLYTFIVYKQSSTNVQYCSKDTKGTHRCIGPYYRGTLLVCHTRKKWQLVDTAVVPFSTTGWIFDDQLDSTSCEKKWELVDLAKKCRPIACQAIAIRAVPPHSHIKDTKK